MFNRSHQPTSLFLRPTEWSQHSVTRRALRNAVGCLFVSAGCLLTACSGSEEPTAATQTLAAALKLQAVTGDKSDKGNRSESNHTSPIGPVDFLFADGKMAYAP